MTISCGSRERRRQQRAGRILTLGLGEGGRGLDGTTTYTVQAAGRAAEDAGGDHGAADARVAPSAAAAAVRRRHAVAPPAVAPHGHAAAAHAAQLRLRLRLARTAGGGLGYLFSASPTSPPDSLRYTCGRSLLLSRCRHPQFIKLYGSPSVSNVCVRGGGGGMRFADAADASGELLLQRDAGHTRRDGRRGGGVGSRLATRRGRRACRSRRVAHLGAAGAAPLRGPA